MQPTKFRNLAFIALFLLNGNGFLWKNTDPVDDPDDPVVVDPKLGTGSPGLVGTAGLNAWDALPVSEKDRIKAWNTIFYTNLWARDLEEGYQSQWFSV